MPLRDKKVYMITGAGKGIGRAIALRLAAKASNQSKVRLFLVSRTAKDLRKVAILCEKQGAEVLTHAADLSTHKVCVKAVQECIKGFQGLDVLVNNAGVGRFGDFLDLNGEDLEHTLNTNLKGLFFLTQEAFRHMVIEKSGDLVFVTSVAAEKPFEQSSIYCMSKFGQKGLLEVLRIPARRNNIRIMNVMPGPIHTPMWGKVDASMRSKMVHVEDCATAIVDAMLLPRPAQVEELVIRPVTGDLP